MVVPRTWGVFVFWRKDWWSWLTAASLLSLAVQSLERRQPAPLSLSLSNLHHRGSILGLSHSRVMNPLSETNVGFAHYLMNADDSGTSNFAHNGLGVLQFESCIFIMFFFYKKVTFLSGELKMGFNILFIHNIILSWWYVLRFHHFTIHVLKIKMKKQCI